MSLFATPRFQPTVLYSFPHKLGADRICLTAWHQVRALAAAGARVIVCPGVLHRPLPPAVTVRPTLARGAFRIPYRLLGRMRAMALHDRIVARRLEQLAGQVDLVHAWPTAALVTLRTAARLGIPTLLERPNAHTAFAYEVVARECARLGLTLPRHHEHAYHADVLEKEEQEYLAATRLLCPSDFVARTFRERGFPSERLVRHQYGYDPNRFAPAAEPLPGPALRVLFAGGCAPRKGLHLALRAWLASPASRTGTFQIAGAFVPGYAGILATELGHPSVKVLGHRTDLSELMRASDVLVLPSIEEGSALVTYEARGSGCVLLVSTAAGAVCRDGVDALVHAPGDVEALTAHFTLLHEQRSLLLALRAASVATLPEITWRASGVRLLAACQETLSANRLTVPVS